MSDITFELGAEAGDDVTFDVGPVAGDDVSFDIPEPGTTGIPDHGVLTGRDDPDQHPASAIDVDGTPLDQVLADLPGGGSAVTADFVLGVDAVDGTGDAFSLLLPTADPSGFSSSGSIDAETFAGILSGAFPDGATIAIPTGDHAGVYAVTADTLTSPWTQVAATLVATYASGFAADWLAAVIPDEAMRTLYPSPEVRAANLTTPPPLVDSGKWLLTKGDSTSYASCPVPGPLTGLDVRFKVAARAPLPEPAEPGEKRYLEFATIPHPDFDDLDLLEIALEWEATEGLLGHYAEFHRGGDPVVEHGEYDGGRIQTLESGFRLPLGHAWEGRYTIDPDAGDIAFWVRVLDYGDATTEDGRHWRRVARKTVTPFTMSEQIGTGKTVVVGIHDGLLAVGEVEFRDGIDGDLWANLPLSGTLDDAGNTWTFHGDATVVDASLAAIGTGGGGVALGETSSTAYRGDRGKTAYDHSQVVTGNPHGTTAADVGAAATSHTHAASAIASGTIDIARIPTGTTGSTVPFGNDSRFSDSRTPTDASVTAAKLDATLAGRIPTTVVMGSDVPSNTGIGPPAGTTLVDTTGLSFTVTNGVRYFIDAWLEVTGDTSADLKIGVTCPSGTLRLSVWGISNIASGISASIVTDSLITASGGSVSSFGVITSNPTGVWLRGYFTASADGTFQIQHAQRSNTATATTVKAGSYLTYHT